jgi:hypothetical protein
LMYSPNSNPAVRSLRVSVVFPAPFGPAIINRKGRSPGTVND